MSATLTVLYRSFWNFACVFIVIWGYACGLDVIVRLFFVFFPHCELSHFSPAIYRQWVAHEHNSSYNFIPIFKLCTCFLHSLKMCMCFWYNPCFNFCHFFLLCEILSFSDLRFYESTLWSQLFIQFYTGLFETLHVFSRVCRCACGLDIIFRFVVVTFSSLLTLWFS